jgi:hypothetical protein
MVRSERHMVSNRAHGDPPQSLKIGMAATSVGIPWMVMLELASGRGNFETAPKNAYDLLTLYGHMKFATVTAQSRDTMQRLPRPNWYRSTAPSRSKVVFTSREHIIALEARDEGMVGTTLRYPYEVRQEKDYFDVIEDEKVPREMLDLQGDRGKETAKHVTRTRAKQKKAG